MTDPDIDGETLDALQSHLEANAVGRDNAIVSDALADVIESEDTHDTNPTVRAACRALLAERGVPVKGGPTGFYIVRPGAEAEAAKESLREEIGALNTRLIHLREALDGYAYSDDGDASDGPTCAKCGGAIDGDAWLWYSEELCKSCYDERPHTEGRFKEWVEA